MASPSEKLAESLEALRKLQEQGIVAIQAKSLTRTHRERLIKNGFLQEVIKGWFNHLDRMKHPVKAPHGMLLFGNSALPT